MHRFARTALTALVLAGIVLSPQGARGNGAPAHLTWAESLVDTITPANNDYGSPTDVRWKNTNGNTASFNRSVCATFLTTLIKTAYGLTASDIQDWMGSPSPYAEDYHHEIVAGNGWSRVSQVGSIVAGDILAIDYRDGSSSTGHVAVAASAPILIGDVTVAGVIRRAYDVWVVDSSSSTHGSLDTRNQKKDGNVADKGVGEGVMRIYADKQTGAVTGHAWSNWSGSTVYPQPGQDLTGAGRHLVIGRL